MRRNQIRLHDLVLAGRPGLRHDLELPYEEIADLLELPLGTVKNKIFKARRLLGRRLEELNGTM